MKFAPLGNTSTGSACIAAGEAFALADDELHAIFHLVDESEREAAGDLLRGVEVVRQHHLVELGDEPAGPTRYPSRSRPSTTSWRTCG
jgi:hypothetical protein